MRYRFSNFEFDSTSLVLKRNGEALAIRHNEAKILKLLLEHSDNVFSKASGYEDYFLDLPKLTLMYFKNCLAKKTSYN